MIILRQKEFGGRSVYANLSEEEAALKRADRDNLARELLQKRKEVNNKVTEANNNYDNLKNSRGLVTKSSLERAKKAKKSAEYDRNYEYGQLLKKSKIKSESIDSRYDKFHNSGTTAKRVSSGGYNNTQFQKRQTPIQKPKSTRNAKMLGLGLGAATLGAGAYLLYNNNKKKKKEEDKDKDKED